MNTKLFRLFASLLLVFAAPTAFAYDFAVENSDGVTIYYNNTSTTKQTLEVTFKDTNYNSYAGDVVVPTVVTYNDKSYRVTSVGEFAFYNCGSLKSVTLPNNVTKIGKCAFSFCNILSSMEIPTRVNSIAEDAFQGCRSLTSMAIPNSVDIIEGNVFKGCAGLKEINVGDGNENYASVDGVLFDKDMSQLIAFPGGHESKNYTIPYGVLTVGEYAFSQCDVTSVEFPNTIIEIGDGAFSSCNSLTSMIFPDYVKRIGKDAFHDCQYMKSVILPNNITGIEDGTFNKCYKLEKVIMPATVEYIGEYAFAECNSLKKMICLASTPPDSTESTVAEASIAECFLSVLREKVDVYISAEGWKDFYDVSANSFDLYGNSNNNIIYYNFVDLKSGDFCEVTCTEMFAADYKGEVEIPSCVIYYGISFEVKKIGEYAFFSCPDLTAVFLPRTLTLIDMLGFGYCPGLTSIDLPQSLVAIGGGAFAYSTGLTSITIPANVRSIDGNIFEGCSSLKEIIVEGANKSYASYQGVLFNKDETELIAFPAGHETKNYTIPNSVVKICDLAFIYCNGLTYVTIPNSVRYFGKVPFKSCGSLREFNVAYDNLAFSSLDGVLFSKDQMQLYCFPISHKSTDYTVPNDVLTIEDYAFGGCVNLTALTFPESVISLGIGTLYECEKLRNLVCLNPMPPTVGDSFQESRVTNGVLKVPKESVYDYKTADYWKDFLHIVGIESSGVATIATDTDTDAPAYDLQGAKVTDNYKGIVIKNGKKFLNVR